MKANNIIIIAYSLLISFAITSCSESDPLVEYEYGKSYISVYSSDTDLEEGEDEGSISISASGSWTVYDCPSWIHLDQTYGYRSRIIVFTVDENETDDLRRGDVRVRTNDMFEKEDYITIRQPASYFKAYMNTTNYRAEGDYWSLFVEAPSSKSWTINRPSNHTWVHLGSISSSLTTYYGSGKESPLIYVDANSSSSSRSSTLTVKCGNKTKNITITQEGKSSPFEITSVSVGNMDYNGNMINSYGSTIYSSDTRYLSPRIYVNVKVSGTYTIYVKLFIPNGTMSTGLSSPSGYTFSQTINLYSYTSSYVNLNGWGNNTPGHWSSGSYRWEFYYLGEKIAEKTFTIY